MSKYKGYTITRQTNYTIQNRGYTYSNASSLTQAKRMARELADREGLPMTVSRRDLYHITNARGVNVSTANSLTAAKRLIDNRVK